ncbi:MAG: glycoside hydrolase [Clostridia bacterium]|nr:glycoside hydrolase [Clostridia bacterium]
MKLKVKMLPNEHWWGGDVNNSNFMPYDCTTEKFITTAGRGRITCQSAPFFLSDKGRYIWSDKGFDITFKKGVIKCQGEMPIILDDSGKTLRDAFINAKRDRFPFTDGLVTEKLFYEVPQFNTWVELIKDQTEEGILRYAEGLVANGYTKGILMIDDGWQKEHGSWQFDPDKFKDPKGMIKKLHDMGFKIMLWISPYISLSSDRFLDLARDHGIETDTGHLLRLKDGRVAIHKWWNGYCAMFDLTREGDRQALKEQLDVLVNEYGVDGFKFDGGDYTWKPINEIDTFAVEGYLGGASDAGVFACSRDPMRYGWRLVETKVPSVDELNEAWVKFGLQYPFHEFKNHHKTGHLHLITRLFDKAHKWGEGGLADLIPQGILVGIIGFPFLCPDMVGGGSWTYFIEENLPKLDHEMFVRMAQCSALFPMMQFSAAPWRVLSKECAGYCLDMAKLHEKMSGYIIEQVKKSEVTGEPILRNMEYQFPNEGLHACLDQFMLGDDYLVAPVLVKGQTVRAVKLPNGKWQDMNDGKVYEGGQTVEVNAPLSVLPYFKKVN